MKKFVMLVIAMIVATASCGFAAPIGALWTDTEGGKVSVGLGYSYVSTKWEPENEGETHFSLSGEDLKTRQHQIHVQLGLTLARGWNVYAGAGLSTLEADNAFQTSTSEVDTGFGFDLGEPDDERYPFGVAGVTGLLYEGNFLDVGLFAQVLYASEYETDVQSQADLGAGTEDVTERFSLDGGWEGTAGVQLQTEFEGAFLYGGLLYYTNKVEAQSVVRSVANPALVNNTKIDLEERGNVAPYAGIRWPLKNGVKIDLELQKKSRTSIGFNLIKTF